MKKHAILTLALLLLLNTVAFAQAPSLEICICDDHDSHEILHRGPLCELCNIGSMIQVKEVIYTCAICGSKGYEILMRCNNCGYFYSIGYIMPSCSHWK